MIGLDTNVLLRILVDDGSEQVSIARRFAADQLERGERLWIDRVVLAELSWVLTTAFDYDRKQIANALHQLLSSGAYQFDDRDVVLAAWEKYREGPAGLADCLIAAKHAFSGCTFTATFDRAMRELPTTRVLG